MEAEEFFTQMYRDIWQSQNIEKIDTYYSTSFTETIDTTDSKNEPLTLSLDYDGIVEQSKIQKKYFRNTTLEIKKCVASENHISVHFYSCSRDIRDDEIKHRCVCGIWRLNEQRKIDRVWAVVTPYYSP